MSAVQIRLNRLDINLHGISAQLVEEAVSDLEATLRRRLQGLRLDGPDRLDIAELALGPVHAEPGIDAAGLRALLVEQIEYALLGSLDAGPEAGSGTTAQGRG
ncbi:MAG: hypothetical protein WBN02_07155 [Sedimenticolaceae bacterium]|jgi:hypothetical protein